MIRGALHIIDLARKANRPLRMYFWMLLILVFTIIDTIRYLGGECELVLLSSSNLLIPFMFGDFGVYTAARSYEKRYNSAEVPINDTSNYNESELL